MNFFEWDSDAGADKCVLMLKWSCDLNSSDLLLLLLLAKTPIKTLHSPKPPDPSAILSSRTCSPRLVLWKMGQAGVNAVPAQLPSENDGGKASRELVILRELRRSMAKTSRRISLTASNFQIFICALRPRQQPRTVTSPAAFMSLPL